MFKIHIIITILKNKNCYNEYNTDIHHCRVGEWINTIGNKQAFIIVFAL